MKLYLILAINRSGSEAPDTEAKWVGSRSDAAAARKNMIGEGFKRGEITTHEIDVPTGKAGLLGFLNLAVSGPDIVVATERLTAKR